jgi:hypothetical protein
VFSRSAHVSIMFQFTSFERHLRSRVRAQYNRRGMRLDTLMRQSHRVLRATVHAWCQIVGKSLQSTRPIHSFRVGTLFSADPELDA